MTEKVIYTLSQPLKPVVYILAEDLEDGVSLSFVNESSKAEYTVAATQSSPEVSSFVDSTQEPQRSNSSVSVEQWKKTKSAEELKKLTPGFDNRGCHCFANAALKQLILNSKGYVAEHYNVPDFAKDLAKAFQDLNQSFYDCREGKGDQKTVTAARTKLIKSIENLSRTQIPGLDGNEEVALEYLKEQFKSYGGQEDDAHIFADAICQLCGLIEPENTLHIHHVYPLVQSWQGKTQIESDGIDNGSYFSIDPDGEDLPTILSSQLESTDETKVDVLNDADEKITLEARHKLSSNRCDDCKSLQSLRIQAKIFLGKDSRKITGAKALLTDNDDQINVILGDKNSEFNCLQFSIRSVVCHSGGKTVNSGHYITLENLGNGDWLVHSDHQTSTFKGNLRKFFATYPDMLPYLFDLKKSEDNL